MMTTYDLMIKVKEILEANGYAIHSPKFANLRDYEYQTSAEKDNKAWREPVSGWGDLTRLLGYTINFEVVYRHNATEDDISVDVMIFNWKDSSGRRIAKERINVNMSDRVINNRVKKIMDLYETL